MDMKKYRDIERLKEKYFDLFTSGERISITEKIDGANAAIRYDSDMRLSREICEEKGECA